ncbi:MAG: T9SS type A sorting domain-containing protein [Candidatus Marinimicrobia bacterium]|nr:T9SS type A sorting domain-containing protein [Candidatus Neomarinimicrobiota bacterium]
MRIYSPLASILMLINIVFSQPDEQYMIDSVASMPNLPLRFEIRDWKQVAIDYDEFVFDFTRTGDYLPLIKWDSVFTVNGQPTFSLPAYVGGVYAGGEAINTMAAIVSASLVGLDKSNQNGSNWVRMCRKYFAENTAGVYFNNPGGGWGASFWYDLLPNILFYQLFDLYPESDDFPNDFISVATRWHEASESMGGSETTIPDFNYTYFNFQFMSPVYSGHREPDAAAGVAWLEYMAWVQTGDPRFLTAAEWGMEYLQNTSDNPYYEILLTYGAYIAARMNAELGTNYDVHKFINWCFGPSSARPGWGIVTGNWNDYDCGGLAGSITDSDGYAFTMNTFESAGALVPLVRYDNHYARAIGKWMLNLVNAARYFYANGLPVENQDGEAWALSYDSTFCISYEGIRHQGQGGISPLATGDAFISGWAPTNFALYGASHVGILGSLVDTTNIKAILKLDLLKTDYFHDDAFPTYLYYNPYDSDQNVEIDVGAESQDLYDAVANTFIIQGVSNVTSFIIPPDSAIVLVVTPANGSVSYDGYKMLVNNVIVDYHYSDTPDTSNHAPVISSLTADPSEVHLGTSSMLTCEAYDPDGDDISYIWSSVGGSISGDDSTATWMAPLQMGDYYVSCTVQDSYGKETRSSLVIVVIDTVQSSITDLVAYYPFSGNANDESDNGYDGGVFGATLTNDRFGNENSAYYFDGVFDRIQVPNNPALNFQDSITVNFWIKPGEIPTQGTETYPISHGSWEERWKFTFTGNRKIRWTINTTDSIGDLDSNTELDTSNFYFMSGLYDGSNIKLYINGVFDVSASLSGLINQTGLDLTIGQSKPGITDFNYKGIIDDIRIYGRVLTEDEIQDLYLESLNTFLDKNFPVEYSLSPNYPNPFNPITKIQYQIPVQTHVTITVFNVLGQIMEVLVDRDMNPGEYTVIWDASKVSSGVYFYQISAESYGQASGFTKVRKCILIK